ncbi:hypothetical protein GCM10027569_39760 [Flindersiella endophytica]
MSPKYGLALVFGTGWSHALPQRNRQVIRARLPCRGITGSRRRIVRCLPDKVTMLVLSFATLGPPGERDKAPT